MSQSHNETQPSDVIWRDDLLSRAALAEPIRQFVIGQMKLRREFSTNNAFVLNIDSDWGAGKTFFLIRLRRHLEAQGHVAVYVDAWANDHAADPLLAIVSDLQAQFDKASEQAGSKQALREQLKPLRESAGRLAVRATVGAIRTAVTRYTDDDFLGDLQDTLSGEGLDAVGRALLKSFEEEKKTIKTFRSSLEIAVNSFIDDARKPPPVFILIDELDRCRPSFAVELLERVKHLFSVNNVAFIVATDTEQLGHVVSGVYGGNFNGGRYLDKFFDRTFRFPRAHLRDFVHETFLRLGLRRELFTPPPNWDVIDFLNFVFEECEIGLRQIEKTLSRLQTFASLWQEKIPIQIAYALPLIHEDQIRSEGQNQPTPMRMVSVDFTGHDYEGRKRSETVSLADFISRVQDLGQDIFAKNQNITGFGLAR
jgi:hypothetical protein